MKNFWNGRSLCAALLLALSGCAGAGDPNAPLNETRAADLIETVLEDIEDLYYRETKASELVAAGLEHVEETYPGVAFVREGDAFSAKVGNESVSSFRAGQDKGDANDWADNVAATLVSIGQTLPEEDPANLGSLTDTFLEGIVGSLDGRTRYILPEEARLGTNSAEGGVGGVSISLKPDPAGWRVAEIVSFTLKESGLLRAGDLILAVDDNTTKGLNSSEVFYLLRGEVDSPATLSVRRAGTSEPLTITVPRELRGSNSVGGFPQGRAHHLVIPRFTGVTPNDLKTILTETVTSDQPAYSGIILDLRSNTGGTLQATVAISALFVEAGRILSTHGRHTDSHQFFRGKNDAAGGLPVVILVNEATAAGAEIVASALQDNSRAIVVGQRTYGLGTIQTALYLPNRGEFIVTWAEVITPANYHLDKRGVLPTVCTGGDVTAEAVLAELRNGAGTIDYATRSRDIDPEDAAAVDAFRALCPPRSDGADIDLEVARAILEAPALYAEILARDRQSKQAAAQ